MVGPRRRRGGVWSLLLAVGIAGAGATCSSLDTNERGPVQTADAGEVFRIPVTVETDDGPITFQSEIADSPAERQRGMMFRESMSDDHGMVFLFPNERQLSFWMKNTFIPLDIIFIRADRTILGIAENAEPRTLTSQRVEGDSQFVLEINGGLARRRGIRSGQKVTFFAPIPEI